MIVCTLKSLLAARGLSQRALARRIRVHRRTIARLCSDDWLLINRYILESICLELRITPQQLLVWEKEDN